MNKEILLKNILVSEWIFFKSVKSIKGKEPCQKIWLLFKLSVKLLVYI